MVDRIESPSAAADTTADDSAARDDIRRQLQARRDFWSHLFVFGVFNTAVVLIWLITSSGYFWPMWLIGAWGVGVVMHGWDVFVRKAVTDDDIDAEIRRRVARGD
jgi:hypothetical protein